MHDQLETPKKDVFISKVYHALKSTTMDYGYNSFLAMEIAPIGLFICLPRPRHESVDTGSRGPKPRVEFIDNGNYLPFI